MFTLSESLTVSGGGKNGFRQLSHAEFQAAQHALSSISNTARNLGGRPGSLSHNAAIIGSSQGNGLHVPGLLQGSDTFVGGARSSLFAGIGGDSISGGSTKILDGSLGISGAQHLSNFALSSDTVNPAGVTAVSVKAPDPGAGHKAYTVNVGDKTSVTINGLSAHDISKLSH
jgi:hypothetical protein